MALEKNHEYIAEIIDYTAEGAGIARIDGRVVFIPGAIMGETVEIKVLKVTKNICYGKVIRILSPSPDRCDSGCPSFPKCGGCDTWHMSRREELKMKSARVKTVLERLGGFEAPPMREIIGQDERTRYRNKCMFPVAQVNGELISGFYRSHSHDIVAEPDCRIQTVTANKMRDAVLAWAREHKISAYDEKSGKGVLRNIFIRSGERFDALCLIVNEIPRATDELVGALTREFPRLSGVCLNINRTRGNTLMGRELVNLYGDLEWEDSLCGLRFKIAPHSFYQVNRAQAERLYEKALEYADLKADTFALDLYCGAGTITLCMAKRAGKVLGVELVPEAIESAKKNARLNNIENAEFICADAGKCAAQLAEDGLTPDVIVVDPPRKGLDPYGIGAILRMSPERIVYVSCDPATLARDLKILCAEDYTLCDVTPVDMFPGTRHCEVVCALRRQDVNS